MGNRTQAENFAIRQKVVEMQNAGYPTEQAQAIAFRMYRDGELIISEIKTDKATQQQHQQMRTARTINSIFALYQLAKRAFK